MAFSQFYPLTNTGRFFPL